MGVYIKGMKMPKDCLECLMQVYYSSGKTWCKLTDMILAEDYKPIPFDGRPKWCPLIEVSEPHGDLIDRQKLLEDNKHLEYPTNELYRRYRAWAVGFNSGASHCNEHAVYAKTVIEAEGE